MPLSLAGATGAHSEAPQFRESVMPVADEFVRRESDHRQDRLRGAAFRPDESNRLKYTFI